MRRQSRLRAELTEAQRELEELRLARQRQEGLVESIVRQRDMYRSLLHQQAHQQVRHGAGSGGGQPALPAAGRCPSISGCVNKRTLFSCMFFIV